MVNRRAFIYSTVAFILAAVVITVFVSLIRYFIMQREQKSDIVNDLLANQGRSNLSDEVLRSIKPPEDAKSIKLSNDLLNSIAPPTGTKPIEIQQSVIDSIAPQASQ